MKNQFDKIINSRWSMNQFYFSKYYLLNSFGLIFAANFQPLNRIIAMKKDELKKAISTKTMEFEIAMSLEKPHAELFKIYKELKELQFKLVEAEYNLQETT